MTACFEDVLADIKAKRTALDRALVELDIAIAGIERIGLSAIVSAQAPLSGLTLPQALTEALRIAKQPQTNRQLQNILKTGGIKVTKTFAAQVYNTLHRLSGSRFSCDHGLWSLRE